MLCLEIILPTMLILPEAVVGGINFGSLKIQTLLFLEDLVQTPSSPMYIKQNFKSPIKLNMYVNLDF